MKEKMYKLINWVITLNPSLFIINEEKTNHPYISNYWAEYIKDDIKIRIEKQSHTIPSLYINNEPINYAFHGEYEDGEFRDEKIWEMLDNWFHENVIYPMINEHERQKKIKMELDVNRVLNVVFHDRQ